MSPLLPLLLACTDVDLAPPEGDGVADEATLDALALEHAWDTPSLVRVGVPTPRFGRQGPVATIAPPARWPGVAPVVAADPEGDSFRILTEDDGVRLLFWLDADGLAPAVRANVRLDGAGRRVDDDDAGIWALAGTPVESGRWTFSGVGFATTELPIDPGWVDVAFTQDRRPEPGAGEVVGLQGGTLFEDDEGLPLTRTWTDGAPLGARVVAVDDTDGALLVEAPIGGSPLVRGWVPADAVADSPYLDDGVRYRCGFGMHFGDWNLLFEPIGALPAGTLLYDAPGGDLVGITTYDTEASMDPDEDVVDGLTAFKLDSDFGTVVVWAERGD